MMTVAPVASAADAASYYSSKDNYYFLDDMPTQWLGEGARELGLDGPVDLDAFTAILHGKLPNGTELGKEVQGSHVHRPGHDFTFSAPKSVSMLILAGGDKRLLEAHHESVKETLAIMEQMVSARDTKEGVTRIVPTGKMVAALFTHDTSRNLDPEIHTHAVVANVTELDGKWKALATDYIHGAGFIETVYRNQVIYGKIYRNIMKGKTEAIGYETELTGGPHDLWEVKGFSRDVIEEFSSRHREIRARAGEEASLKSRDVAALDTRQRKQDISRYGEERMPSVEKEKGRPDASERELPGTARRNKGPVQTERIHASGEVQDAPVIKTETAPEKPEVTASADMSPAAAEHDLPSGEAPDEPASRAEPTSEEPEVATSTGVSRAAAERDLPSGEAPDVSVIKAEPTTEEQEVAASAGTSPTAPEPAERGLTSGEEQDAPIVKPETADGRARLRERWQRQMDNIGFDINSVINEAKSREATLSGTGEVLPVIPEAMAAVRTAISVLSDSRTRFTYGDLLLTAHESGEMQQKLPDLRNAIDQAISEDLLTPLDGEKGVFTSHIHLLDELSVQSLMTDIQKENKVVSFRTPENEPPEHLRKVIRAPVAILNAPASVQRLRETVGELVTLSREQGREVKVLASSAERALSLGKSEILKKDILPRSRVQESTFSLATQSTLIVEGAEKLGLKEMLILTAEAREKSVQLLFLDSAGRQSAANALSVLTSAGAERYALNTTASELEVRVFSIQDKRDRYQTLADRFAELSSPDNPVTAVVVGAREQQQLTSVIRDALQNAGKLGRDTVTVQTRTPVFVNSKERKLPGTYRAGMVLEDRTDKLETRHYVIDRVHDDTRMLSVIDGDGVLSRVKLSELTGDWRLFTQNNLSVASGEQLFVLAADKAAGLKARDRLTVTSAGPGMLTVQREGQKKTVNLKTDVPLYVTHGYVSTPGGRDNEHGTVLASLGARDLSANMINMLAQSGTTAEIFTAETQDRAEDKLGRLRDNRSPLSLVRQLSGQDETDAAIDVLKERLQSDVQKAVSRGVSNMSEVMFSSAMLIEQATKFLGHAKGIQGEISRLLTEGELIQVNVAGKQLFVARVAWEMEKAIITEIEAGKNTQVPLMANPADVLPSTLTAGQRESSSLILQTTDRFTAVQGYAGVGKTTQFNAVKTAINTLPENARPTIIGLGPTHRAVKEMRSIGIDGQTMKSFLVDWQQRSASGEQVSYAGSLFLIDEASMLGNQDTADALRAIAAGNGRAVMVGDKAQLESPESGAPFRLLQERSPIDVAVMKEIKRQLNDDLRGAVYDVIENKAVAALEKIERVSPDTVPRQSGSGVPDKSVKEILPPGKDNDGNEVRGPTVVDAIVADYMSRTTAAREETLIVVSLNDDRRAINVGIHKAMVDARELGIQAVMVPVLERISGGRHDFNRLESWGIGQVVLAGDRYLSVTGVDRGTRNVLLRDDEGRMRYYSPAELNATEIEVFSQKKLELRTGDSVRMSKTQRNAGHAAHEQYKVTALRENGEIVLSGASGEKVINPGDSKADRHIDYAWAVTGYGAQAASSRFVIALESALGRRGVMSGMRTFYISLSRAKEHVQVYTDGLKKWKDALIREDKGVKTAHDALSPETERKQARSIWAMGKKVSGTAIGRAFLKGNGLAGSPVTARIIPPTRKYPLPHLALPTFDGNGKAAGLTLVPLSHENGVIAPGKLRQLATHGAQAAVLQKSRSGETIIVSDLAQGLVAARERPEAGVLLLTGRQSPSAQLLKVVGGQHEQATRPDATLLSLVRAELQDFLRQLPQDAPTPDDRAALRHALDALNKAAALPDVKMDEKPQQNHDGLEKIVLAAELATRLTESIRTKLPALPGENSPDYSTLVRQASESLVQGEDVPQDAAMRAVLNALSGSGLPPDITLPGATIAGDAIPVSVVRQVQDELGRSRMADKDIPDTVTVKALESAARELARQEQPQMPQEARGREHERELPTPEITRHIQKER